MSKKHQKMLYRILVTAVLFFTLFILEKLGRLELVPIWGQALLYAVPYLIIGYDVLYRAARNIRNGHVFDEHFLMMIATFAAYGTGEFTEACAVMLFYQVGELFQGVAVGKSRASIAEMMSIAPDFANVEQEDGSIEEVDPDEVAVGSIIVIRPGEKIPLDGVVTEGESFVDTAALTGESVPRKASVGSEVISGCVNGDSTLKVRTTKCYEDSTVAKILELVENASSKKSRMENFITRFARYYTPTVTIGAALLAVIPPLVLQESFVGWIQRACIFLIVSCPCALVISVPLGFFGGIGAASRIGVLVKGSNYLEAVAQMDTLVFDKTGTLTKGEFKVTKILPADAQEESVQEAAAQTALLEIAALGEAYSTHPIAQSILEAYGKQPDLSRVGTETEVAGHGLKTTIDGKEVLIGNAKLMGDAGIAVNVPQGGGTMVYLAQEGRFLGTIVIDDEIKEGAAEAIRRMKQVGIERCICLTGDRKEAGEIVAKALGVDEVYTELLPADKVVHVERMLGLEKEKRKLGFVGDGINDAPVLMRADVGIAMGSLGSDAAIEAADIVLMDDDLRKIASIVKIGRKTLRIVTQNVVFALGVKGLVLLLGALGMANMWEAVFADVGVAVIAILNSMRALNTK